MEINFISPVKRSGVLIKKKKVEKATLCSFSHREKNRAIQAPRASLAEIQRKQGDDGKTGQGGLILMELWHFQETWFVLWRGT